NVFLHFQTYLLISGIGVVKNSDATCTLCDDLGKISDGRELGKQTGQQSQTVLPDGRISIVNQNFIEERIYSRPKAGDGSQLFAIRRVRFCLLANAQEVP